MTSRVVQIIDRTSHDKLINEAHIIGQPAVLYVSKSSLPGCKAFTPQYAALADEYPGVHFYQVEYSRETHDLFKFAPNELPVLILVKGNWARMIMGANHAELVAGVEGMLSESQGGDG